MVEKYTRLPNPVLVVVVLSVLAAACSKAGDPVDAAREFHAFTVEGKWDEAAKLVDFDAKSRLMLGDLYDQAPEEDKAVTRDYWAERLKEVTAKYLAGHFRSGPGEFAVREQGEGTAEVVQREDRFALVYSLEKRDAGWIIVDRTHETNGHKPSATAAMSFMLRRMEKELSHPPTLKEVNERLGNYTTHMRFRGYKIDRLPLKEGK